MKRFLLTMMIFLSMVSAGQAWTLLDDFDSYDNTNTATTIATGGVWTSVFDGTANSNIIDYEDGKVLQTLGGAAWRGAKRDLTGTDAAVLIGEVKTYYWRVRCSYSGPDTTDWVYDFMMGLAPDVSNIDQNDAWQDFSIMPFINNAPTTPYINAEAPTEPWWALMSPDTWTNVWVVINNDATNPSFDLYYATDDEAPILVVSNANWRNFPVGSDLNAIGFMAAGGANTEFLIDFICYTDGESLDIPSIEYGAPSNPVPANNAENYGERVGDNVTVQLQWNTGMDPEDPEQVWDQILVHYLYMSKDQAVSNDANLYPVDTLYPPADFEIPADGPTAEATVTGLNFDGWYLWQVVEGVDDGTGNPYPLGDPNNIAGPVWAFGSRVSRPVIVEHPDSALVDAGETVEFSVSVESISPASYQWFKADGPERDEENDIPLTDLNMDNATLILTDVQIEDEGYYYCKVANPHIEYSNMARLGIRRLVAHWTLDEQDYDPVEGLYLDLSGEGRHAEPNGVPTFVEGQLGDAVSILRQSGAVPSTESWARAGTWSPSEFSGQLTVSFWLKWAGTNGTWQGFIAKRSMGDWGNDTVMWQISTDNNQPHLWLESPRGQIAVNNGLVADQWQYIVATFDGSTGALYIDGERRASGNFQLGDALDAMLCLGGNGFEGAGREWMNGDLDDVRIYNYALDELDIAVNYTTDAPDKTACVQGLRPDLMFDLNEDCIVDIGDFAIFAADWLECGIVPDCLP